MLSLDNAITLREICSNISTEYAQRFGPSAFTLKQKHNNVDAERSLRIIFLVFLQHIQIEETTGKWHQKMTFLERILDIDRSRLSL